MEEAILGLKDHILFVGSGVYVHHFICGGGSNRMHCGGHVMLWAMFCREALLWLISVLSCGWLTKQDNRNVEYVYIVKKTSKCMNSQGQPDTEVQKENYEIWK